VGRPPQDEEEPLVVVFEGLAAVVLLEQNRGVQDSEEPNNLTYVPVMMQDWYSHYWRRVFVWGSPVGSCCDAILQQLGILHLYFHIIRTVLGRLSRAIIRPQPNGCLGFLLRIRFILQCLDSVDCQS
jgi:hypothetical protein